mmetsp:Transcript_11125/g.7725  ORF Transcript_11125/g.7725 Transcript_11125/m.7725 type:complete len:124 (-) Transcript_11125:68-439(-)
MMSSTKDIYIKMQGCDDVSKPIHCFTPGTQSKFALRMQNKLYEFGYSTELYLASKSTSQYIYTKITTIMPLYMVLNQTDLDISFAQENCQKTGIVIKPGKQQQFNWTNTDENFLACVKLLNYN